MKKSLAVFIIIFVAGIAYAGDFVFSGDFKGGYKFYLGSEDSLAVKEPQAKGKELKLNLSIKNDFATVMFKNITSGGSNDDNFSPSVTVEMDVDKVINTGDLKFALNFGNNKAVSALSSYNDVSTDGFGKLLVNGDYTGQAKFGYKNLKLQLYFSPVKGNIYKDQNDYGEYGASLSGAFADDSVSASLSYINGAKIKLVSIDDKNNVAKIKYGSSVTDLYSKHGISISAKVDISKLARMKNSLIFSFYNHILPNAKFYFSSNEPMQFGRMYSSFVDNFGVNLFASNGKISSWAEFRLDTWLNTYSESFTADEFVYEKESLGNVVIPGFLFNVKYSFSDFMSLGVTSAVENFKMTKKSWKVLGLFTLGIFNVEFGYKAIDGYFNIKPFLKVKF